MTSQKSLEDNINSMYSWAEKKNKKMTGYDYIRPTLIGISVIVFTGITFAVYQSNEEEFKYCDCDKIEMVP